MREKTLTRRGKLAHYDTKKRVIVIAFGEGGGGRGLFNVTFCFRRPRGVGVGGQKKGNPKTNNPIFSKGTNNKKNITMNKCFMNIK